MNSEHMCHIERY